MTTPTGESQPTAVRFPQRARPSGNWPTGRFFGRNARMPIPRSALGSIIIAASALGAAAVAVSTTTAHAQQQQAAPAAAAPPASHLPLGVSPELYNLSVPAGRRPT